MQVPSSNSLAAWFVEHVRAVRAETSLSSLHDVWSRFIVDVWFKCLLRARSLRAAKRRGISASWSDDVADDVVLRLRELLQDDLTLGFDLRRGEVKFPNWLGTIVYRQALKAADRLARQTPAATELLDDRCPASNNRTVSRANTLAQRLNRFPNTKKAIAHRLAKGHSMREISLQLQLPYKRVRQLAAEIRQTLKAEYFDP